MHSGFVQSYIRFPNRRKDVFYIRKRLDNQRNNDAKTTKITWNRRHIRPQFVQRTFWRRSGASWGAQGVPDRILGMKSWFVGPLSGPPDGVHFSWFVQCRIRLNFRLISGHILEWFCIHFRGQHGSQNWSEMENVCFCFWASRWCDSLILEVLGVQNR